ncbi:MAG: hypothetical protein ACOY0T_16465 [Myxococcota bacterium]
MNERKESNASSSMAWRVTIVSVMLASIGCSAGNGDAGGAEGGNGNASGGRSATQGGSTSTTQGGTQNQGGSAQAQGGSAQSQGGSQQAQGGSAQGGKQGQGGAAQGGNQGQGGRSNSGGALGSGGSGTGGTGTGGATANGGKVGSGGQGSGGTSSGNGGTPGSGGANTGNGGSSGNSCSNVGGGSCPASLSCPNGMNCGCYIVSGLGANKKKILDAGGDIRFLASAMMETEKLTTDYPHGDNKTGDSFNAGLCKQNWYMMRQCHPAWKGMSASQYETSSVLNSDTKLDVTVYNECRSMYPDNQWFAGHRNGQTGIMNPNTSDIAGFRAATEWTQARLAGHTCDDVRFWVDVKPIIIE